MYSATIHNPAIAINRIPVYLAINKKKAQRYMLCLEMAGTVIRDFFPGKQAAATSLFQTLGQVACCIDNHLDDLNFQQKEKLLELFPVFFDSLGEQANEIIFGDRLWQLCDQLDTSLYPPSLCTDLYQFYCFCKKHELIEELKIFSIIVIESAISKSKAQTGSEILQSLAMEGNAAVSFLLQLSEKEGCIKNDRKSKKLKNYLGRLEKMLNIADDLSDFKKDKAKGTITLKTSSSYYFTLSGKLLKTFFSTIFNYHFLFLKHFFVFTGRYIRSELS